MGFRIPFIVSSMASQANQLYPHAVCLKESIRTYELTCQKVLVIDVHCLVDYTTLHLTIQAVIHLSSFLS